MLSSTPTVVNNLSIPLLHTAHMQMPCTTPTVAYSKVSLRDATSYGCSNKGSTTPTLCKAGIPSRTQTAGLTVACILLLLPCQFNACRHGHKLPGTKPVFDEPTVQLKRHLIHQQCTTVSTLQQSEPEVKAHIHANRQAQQHNEEAHHTLPALKKSLDRALPPMTRAQILIHIAYNAYFLLKQVLYCVLCMLNMALCTPLPLLIHSI